MYQLTKVRDAVVKDGKVIQLAVYEFTPLIKAIDAEGKEVTIRGQRQQIRLDVVENKIDVLETELASLKAIKADMTKES